VSTALVVRIFFPFALGYFLASVFRSINSVIAPELVRDLGLSASELGFASSVYYLSAVLLQLPYGVLLDRLDPRKLFACLVWTTALGAVITAFADGIFTLGLGRALIALAGAGGAVTSYKVFSVWYRDQHLPLANGLCLAAGGLGLMVGTAPVRTALQVIDWRDVHLIVAGGLLITGVLILTIAPYKKSESAGSPVGQQTDSFSVILRSLQFWRAAPLMTVVIGTYAGVSTLWSGPWLRDVARMPDVSTAKVLLLLTGAFVLSGSMTGWLAGVARRLGLSIMGFTATIAGLFALVLLVLSLQWVSSTIVVSATWALFGFLAPLFMVTYAALGSQFSKQLTGRLNACLTLAWMLGAFVIQNLYGLVLRSFPSLNGSYAIEGHRLAMGTLTTLIVVALVWFVASTLLIRARGRSAPSK